MTEYALFKDGKQISKSHSTRRAAGMEAYEHSAVVHMSIDFTGDRQLNPLATGYEIREIKAPSAPA